MIVITGASDGLGLEVAKLYKAEGKIVTNVSRTECKYADHNLLHDLRDGREIVTAAKEIRRIEEPIEAIINCAGVISFQRLGEISEDEIKRLMATNVKAPILLVSNLIQRIKKDGADVVNVSSMAGVKPMADVIVYSASKWALRGFSADLQVELKNYASRVISFCPGSFETKIVEKNTGISVEGDGVKRMAVKDVAVCLKQLLDLPKNIEISEILVTRKQPTE